MPSTRRSGSIDIALSTASIWATTINSISFLKSSLLCNGMFGMRMRLMWLVTPTGRIPSNSGCTDVLVDGTSTANFLRQPRASGIALLRGDRKLEGRLLRSRKARFFLGSLPQGFNRSAEVEDLHLAALFRHAGTELLRCRFVDCTSWVENDAVSLRAVAGHEAATDFLGDQRRIARQRIAPSAAPPGHIVQEVARVDLHAVTLRGQDLLRTVLADHQLAAARAGLSAVDAPRIGEPAIVVDRDLASLEKPVGDLDPVAATECSGTARVRDRLITLDTQREV